MKKLLGYSLSFCVKDIIDGKVYIGDVFGIEAGTDCRTQDDWDKVLRSYSGLYWASKPRKAAKIARKLIAEGRVFQPRLHGDQPRNLADGVYWKELEEPIEESTDEKLCITQLITDLQNIYASHGDLPVFVGVGGDAYCVDWWSSVSGGGHLPKRFQLIARIPTDD